MWLRFRTSSTTVSASRSCAHIRFLSQKNCANPNPPSRIAAPYPSDRSIDCHSPIRSPVNDTACVPATRLPQRASVAEVIEACPIEEHDKDVSQFMEVPLHVDLALMKHVPPPQEFGRTPYQHREDDIDQISTHSLQKRRQRTPLQRVQSLRLVHLENTPCFSRVFHRTIIRASWIPF